jgi:AbrB family looped-hinge helix DNA binding protein
METYISNGRIVIPALVRRELGIKQGTRIHVELDAQNRKIILTPITREYIHHLRGKFKGRGLLKSLMAAKELERGPRTV